MESDKNYSKKGFCRSHSRESEKSYELAFRLGFVAENNDSIQKFTVDLLPGIVISQNSGYGLKI